MLQCSLKVIESPWKSYFPSYFSPYFPYKWDLVCVCDWIEICTALRCYNIYKGFSKAKAKFFSISCRIEKKHNPKSLDPAKPLTKPDLGLFSVHCNLAPSPKWQNLDIFLRLLSEWQVWDGHPLVCNPCVAVLSQKTRRHALFVQFRHRDSTGIWMTIFGPFLKISSVWNFFASILRWLLVFFSNGILALLEGRIVWEVYLFYCRFIFPLLRQHYVLSGWLATSWRPVLFSIFPTCHPASTPLLVKIWIQR